MHITTTGYELKIDLEGLDVDLLSRIDDDVLSNRYDVRSYRQTPYAAYIRFNNKESELAFILEHDCTLPIDKVT